MSQLNLPSLQLLFSSLLLISSPASAAAQEKVAYECSKWQTSETLTFGCKNGYRIQILRAFYGYSSEEKHCFYEPGDCYEETLIDQCSGVTRCTAIVEKSSMGACGWNFHDYLQIHYTCRPGAPGPDISNNDKRSGFPPGNFDATKLVNAGQVTACVVVAVVVFAILAVVGATIYRKKRRRHSDDEFSSSDFSDIINPEEHSHPRGGGVGGGGGSSSSSLHPAVNPGASSAHPSTHGASAPTSASNNNIDNQYSASLKRSGPGGPNNHKSSRSGSSGSAGGVGGQQVVSEDSRNNKRTNNNSRLSRSSVGDATSGINNGGQPPKAALYYHHNNHHHNQHPHNNSSSTGVSNRHHPIYVGGIGVNNVNKTSSSSSGVGLHPVGFIQMQNIRDPAVAAATFAAYPSYSVAAPPPPPPPLHPRLVTAGIGSEISSSDLEDDAGESRPNSVGGIAPMLPPRRFNNNNVGINIYNHHHAAAPTAALATASYAQIRGFDVDDDEEDNDPPPSYEEAASFFDNATESRLNNGSNNNNNSGIATTSFNNNNNNNPTTTITTTMDNRQIVLNGPNPFLAAALSSSGENVDAASAADSGAVSGSRSGAVSGSFDAADSAASEPSVEVKSKGQQQQETAAFETEESSTAPPAAEDAVESADAHDANLDQLEASNLDQSEASIVATTPLLASSSVTHEDRENDATVVVPTQELLSS